MAGSSKLDATLGVLNGLVGDHLARTGNGLATPMALMHEGAVLGMTPSMLSRAYPAPTGQLVLLVHGLMSTESVWRFPDGSNYATKLEDELGFTPLSVRYNTGRPIAESGAELADLLGRLLAAFPTPVEELVLIGHSMGGLVIRSACEIAATQRQRWLEKVHRAFYLASPHLGAPLERLGRVLTRTLRAINDPYTRLVADIANLRSDGIKDLGTGQTGQAKSERCRPQPVVLVEGIRHHLIAGVVGGPPLLGALFGDSMVPLPSAIAGLQPAATPVGPFCRVRILTGVSHLSLAHHPQAYLQIRSWLEAPA